MAGLYEQAIVEAKQIAEAAMKRAEQDVIEKHSKQIKEAVNSLLDRDEEDPMGADPTAMDPMGAGPAGAVDPMSTTIPTDGTDITSLDTPDAIMNKIPSAATTDDDKIIEVDFQGLKDAIDAELKADQPSHEDLAADVAQEPMNVDPEALDINADEENEEIPIDLQEDVEVQEEGARSGIWTDEEASERIIKRDPFIGEPIPTQKTDSFEDEDIGDFDFEDEDIGDFDFEDEEDSIEIAPDYPEQEEMIDDDSDIFDDNFLEEEASAMAAGAVEGAADKDVFELEEELDVDFEQVPSGQFAPRSPCDAKHELFQKAAATKAKEDSENEEAKEKMSKMENAIAELKESKNSLKRRFISLQETAKELGKKLCEANVINAKLLYANKTLRNDSLNERQKTQLAEAISKAKTVEEAKKTYEVLQEGLKSVSSMNKKERSLSEVVSARNKSLTIVRENQDTIENPAKERMQLLAGLKRTK